MIRFYAFWIGIIFPCFCLFSGEKDPQYAEDFTLKFTKEEWIRVGSRMRVSQDTVLLRDGSKLQGRLEQVPAIQYFFGQVDFDVKEVSALVFAPYFNKPKMQVVTWSGENYIGDMPLEKLKFYEKKFENHSYRYELVELEVGNIDTIVLRKRKKNKPYIHESVMSMVLHNGDRFPFVGETFAINVQGDSDPYELRVDSIIDLRNRGGLEGYVKGDALDKKIPFTRVLDQALPIKLAKDGQKLQVPWIEIARIMGDSGAFILTSPYIFQLKKVENMVYVPPGKFFFGTNINAFKDVEGIPALLSKKHLSPYTVAQLLFNAEAQDFVESPPVLIEMPGFYIDKYEVTNRDYALYIQETGAPPPRHWEKGRYPEGMAEHPVVNVTYKEARAYANWAGKRLPSEIEWERAAKGASGFPYPYGADFEEGISNVSSEGTAAVGSFEKHMYSQKYNPEIFQKEIQDMSGNVQEWTSSPYDYGYLKKLYEAKEVLFNPKNLGQHPLKVVKGGSFKSSPPTATTTFRSPMHEEDLNEFTGFRCMIYDRDVPYL